MNHPEIIKLNASLYYEKLAKDADDYRRVKKIRNKQPQLPYFSAKVFMALLKTILPLPNHKKEYL
jgi:hypothetical protein